jgi:hypothetical protein
MPEFVARPRDCSTRSARRSATRTSTCRCTPTFSSRTILRGTDEAAIRDFFKPGVVRAFEECEGLSVEAKLDRFIVYRPGRLVKPEQWGDGCTAAGPRPRVRG